MGRLGVAVFVVAALCAAALACTTRARRPDGPYREAEEFADAFSDEVVACTREHAPEGQGRIAVAAEFTGQGNVPVVHDVGSMEGSDAVVACVRSNVTEKLRSPPSAPAKYVRIRASVPLDTSQVGYAFMHELPPETARGSAP